MTSTIHFERPAFDEIVAAIRRIFPVADGPEFDLLPDSIHHYFEACGISLDWQPIPGWEGYEWGHSEISDEAFVALLFSPRRPRAEENVICVTDECFETHHGFLLSFADLLPFAREVYPQVISRPMDFFQPCDTIFVAEQSRLLVMLHHEGYKTHFAA